MQWWRRTGWIGGLSLAIAGCAAGCGTRIQSALDPAGAQAGSIQHLWWMYFWITTAVYVLVVIFMLIAVSRRTHIYEEAAPAPPDVAPPPQQTHQANSIVGGLVGVTAIILFVMLIGDFLVGRTIEGQLDPHPIVVQVIGHQW